MLEKEKSQDKPLITEDIAQHVKAIIEDLGEDPYRQGLEKTPERVSKSLQFCTSGYDTDPAAILRSAKFEVESHDMIIVKDIELYSLCEHHMLPFFGKAHIAYIPNQWITGLSKLPRVVDCYSRRLQVQERLTHQIVSTIQDVLEPMGAAVVIEAQHLCMMMRGVQKQNSMTTTSAFTGVFKRNETRNEFLRLIT